MILKRDTLYLGFNHKFGGKDPEPPPPFKKNLKNRPISTNYALFASFMYLLITLN